MSGKAFRIALVLGAAMAIAPAGFTASAAQPAIAKSDNGKGHGKGHGNGGDKSREAHPPGHENGHGHGANGEGRGAAFRDGDQAVIANYFHTAYGANDCPPGLAKKNNGCLPPGQAKKLWAQGAPLPSGLSYYPLPDPLLAQLAPAPYGYQYVRVDSDILLIEAATLIVLDAVSFY